MKNEQDLFTDLLKAVPLKERIEVATEMSMIELIHELGYRKSDYWRDTPEDNNILNKLRILSKKLASDIIDEIEENNLDGNAETNITDICTVGTLKKALDSLPNDRFIGCQVVANDGKTWLMRGEFCSKVMLGSIACITLRHDDLKTLPNIK
jgi:hypothetical protein